MATFPTLEQVFSRKSTDEMQEVLVHGVVLKEAVAVDACQICRDDELSQEDIDDDWSVFLEGLGHWAQTDRKTYNRRASRAVANVMLSGYGETTDLFAEAYEKRKKDFDEAIALFTPKQKTDLIAACLAYSTSRAQRQMLRLDVNEYDTTRFLESKPDQTSPSDLAKGFDLESTGYMLFNEFDPSPAKNLHTQLVPSMSGTVTKQISDIQLLLQENSWTRGILPEKEEDSVQPRYNDMAEQIGATPQTKSTKYSILNSPSLGKRTGKMDGSFSMQSPYSAEKWALGVWENTGQEYSTFRGIRQGGAAYGFGIATFLVGVGLPIDDIAVPIVVYTGIQIQFAAVFVLSPSFPVITLLSRAFDLSREDDALIAARYIVKFKEHCNKMEMNVHALLQGTNGQPKALRANEFSLMKIALDQQQYFLKTIDQSYSGHSRKGFELVGKTAEIGSIHMIRVFNELDEKLDASVKPSICFPICFRDAGGGRSQLSLVFDHLGCDSNPYKVGLPADASKWKMWFDSVVTVVGGMHGAGVVHVDLYPSNMMWRATVTGTVEVKLIDFDVAHLTKEGEWKDDVREILEGIASERQDVGWVMYEQVDKKWDLQYIRVLRTLVENVGNKEYEDIFKGLSSGKVGEINDAFREAAFMIDISDVLPERFSAQSMTPFEMLL